jgi:hypothetical protein
MLTERQKMALLAPCLPLRFLVHPEARETSRKQMPDISDSARFYRLWDLTCTLREAEAIKPLDKSEQDIIAEFLRVFGGLPWQTIATYPHIKYLASDDLSALIPAGSDLLRMLERRTKEPPNTALEPTATAP